MKLQQAILQSLGKIARGIACRGAVCIFALLPASPLFAATQSYLNIGVAISSNIAPVTNLTAVAAGAGSINLSWTEPYVSGTTDPRYYDIRASSEGQIPNDVAFAAAKPLSAFSSSPIPFPPGTGGNSAGMTVAGLQAGVVYYFAIREYDSGSLVGSWTRNVSLGWNANNFATPSGGNAPAPVADLAAAPGAAEGDVLLTWTAPASSTQGPLAGYDLRYATYSVVGLGTGAEAWFAAAPYRVSIPTTTATGDAQSTLLHGLYPASTFYFAIKSSDRAGNVSPVDLRAANGPQAQTMPRDLPPAVPSGLAAAAGLNRAVVTWTALTPAQKGLDFAYYTLQRSTYPDHDFVTVATTTAVFLTDKFLVPFTTYYYQLAARDWAGLQSVFTSTVSARPYTIPPLQPLGVLTTPGADGSSVTFSWSPTRSFQDGSPFDSTGTPTADELQGYRIMRSTSVCSPQFTYLSSATVAASSFTAYTGGDIYYFQLESYNTQGPSTSPVIASNGDQNYFLPDCSSRLTITNALAADLSQATNGQGADISIAPQLKTADIAGEVFQSVQFQAVKNAAAVPSFHFSQPAQIVLHYNANNGTPVAMSASAAGAAAVNPRNLGMYWYNGAEFKKLYGTVDTAAQTVSVQTPNLGIFQIRALLRSNGAVFDLSNLSGRVITPNGDGKNDTLIFGYDPGPNNVIPTGKIFDLKGMFVSEMTPGLVPYTLTWDGRMNGKVVTSGIYVYEIKGDGKTFNGTIVVAR